MNTNNWTRHLAWGVLGLVSQQVFSQATQDDNNGGVGSFLGWNAGANQVLEVRNDANQPIDWYTDAIQRMQLYQTRTGVLPILTGGTVNVQQNGYLGLSGTPGFFAANGYGPFSRLHLADLDPGSEGQNHYNQPWGYRTWMRNGVTFTGNHDHAYIGQRYYDHDETDLVLQWSDNADKQTQGPDRMRFIFTSNPLPTAVTGSRSQEGLEFMRLFPVNQFQGFIGVGNYAQPGLAEPEPTERLDLLDQTIRLRDFADASLYRRDNLTRVLVADAADGRVYWKPESQITAGGSGTDCDWTVQNATTSGSGVPHHVFTASGSSDACPDRDDMVGIGAPPSAAKLHVQVNRATDQVPARGMQVELLPEANDAAQGANVIVGSSSAAGASDQVGVTAAVYNGSGQNAGLVGNAFRNQAGTYSDSNHGVKGLSSVTAGQMHSASGVLADAAVSSGASVQHNQGVFARAVGGAIAYGVKAEANGAALNFGGRFDTWDNEDGVVNYGVYAQAPNGAPHWAGYFVGRTYCTLGDWTSSDQQLKINVEPFDGGLEKVMALSPRTYRYNTGEFGFLGFDDSPQVGLIAQELEQVLPELVAEVRHPARYGADGELASPALETKAIRYEGLIPVLIKAMQEQQEQIAELRELILACCSHPGGIDQRQAPATGSSDEERPSSAQERLLRIAPNPFMDRTTLHCTLERSGRMQLLVNSADGRDLRVLSEAQREAGEYQYEWDTTALAPGVYYITLLLDGEPVVKRAVRVRK